MLEKARSAQYGKAFAGGQGARTLNPKSYRNPKRYTLNLSFQIETQSPKTLDPKPLNPKPLIP